MPESPESQIIVDGLRSLTKDRSILSIVPVGGRYTKKSIPGLEKDFSSSAHPIEHVRRHGKAIVLDLASAQHIVVTLGMTGKFSLQREKHAAVEFVYGSARERDSFYFVDQRRFGTVRVVPTETLGSTLPDLGWDALGEDIDVRRVKNDMLSLREGTVIGSAMLDPSTFCGIGNYLRAEILYAAGVSPWRKCTALSDSEISALCEHSRRIVLRSYELGGNTIENFVDLAGGSGKFFQELKVYGKRKDPDGNEVIAEKTPEGRTIHWVPSAQL